MNLTQYISQLKKPPRLHTEVFVIKNNKVILGLKKQGFGKGYWLGIGGKVEPGENIEDAAKREVHEEIGLNLVNIKKVGLVNFYFPHIEDESWNQKVHVFVSDTWTGSPIETEEMAPRWFDINEIPFDKMWDDSRYWLPQIFKGETLQGDFIFDVSANKVTDFLIKPFKGV